MRNFIKVLNSLIVSIVLTIVYLIVVGVTHIIYRLYPRQKIESSTYWKVINHNRGETYFDFESSY